MELSRLRRVEWLLEGAATPRAELVPAEDVELLVEAVLRLHRDPGRNPHSGRPAARLRRLTVGTPYLHEGYWWTAPALDERSPKARVVAWRTTTRYQEPEPDLPDPA